MKIHALIRSIPVFLILVSAPLAAQGRDPLPAGWPDAEVVLARFRSGDQGYQTRTAVAQCPRKSPYGDQLWSALLAQRPTPDLVHRVAAIWTVAMQDCYDPRVAAWWRDRLHEYRADRLIAVRAIAALLRRPTPENISAIKRYLFDESVDPEARSSAFYSLERHWTWERRMDLYFETLRQTRLVPEPYGSDVFSNLMRSPVADSFVRRALEWVEGAPEGPNPARLLSRLASHSEVAKNRAWRSQVENSLARIEANPSGRYPAELVALARSQRDLLSRAPSN